VRVLNASSMNERLRITLASIGTRSLLKSRVDEILVKINVFYVLHLAITMFVPYTLMWILTHC